MATSDFFWKLFKDTGSINAYLIYRQLHPTAAAVT
ncbi:MAG: YqzL family protein [Candidatus Baltobacteraceae bacterium]